MTTPYRNQLDALRERKGSLEREIAELRSQAASLEGLRARQAELDRELGAINAKLGAKERRGPLLDQVRVASPCPARWEDMVGDAAVRFCGGCRKNVYNLSAMPREAAEQLLAERAAGEMCVRFYQRADGTIMTSDCPVGVKRKRRKNLALAVAGAGAMAFGAVAAMSRSHCAMGRVAVQGEMTAIPVPVEPAPQAGEGTVTMGATTVADPAPPPHEVRVRMGARAK